MKGYIVEVDPGIETALFSVMPDVEDLEPLLYQGVGQPCGHRVGKVKKHLEGLEEDRISSQVLKKALLGAAKVAPITWTRIIHTVAEEKHHFPNKEIPLGKRNTPGDGVTFQWRLEGRSLVRETAKVHGFTAGMVSYQRKLFRFKWRKLEVYPLGRSRLPCTVPPTK